MLKLLCKNRKVPIICFRMLLIGIIVDVIVQAVVGCEKISADCKDFFLTYVTSDYINEVFSATCTVAVLGNAVLSILFGASDKVIRGVPFQDILHHSKMGSEQRYTIIATTLSIIVSAMVYAWGLINTLTLILFMDATLIISSSIDLWKLMTSKETQLRVINEILLENTHARHDVYIDNWFRELEQSLAPCNEQAVNEFCEFINKVVPVSSNKEHPVNASVGRHLSALFDSACEKVGFVYAYELITKINSIPKCGFVDAEEIALNQLISLKYVQPGNINIQSLPAVSEAIVEQMTITSEGKARLLYICFRSVKDNVNLRDDAKDELLAGILDYICALQDNEFGEIKQRVLLSIIKSDIILNSDQVSRSSIFHLITASLLRRNRYSDEKVYSASVAEIYRAFYFFIFREQESLAKEYRDGLLVLYRSEQTQMDLIRLSFNYLVKDKIGEICAWLASDATTFDRKRSFFWDYFSPTMNCKRMVWSAESLICFAFCFFNLIGYAYAGQTFREILESEEYTDNEKITVCKTITQLYEQDHLSQTTIDIMREIKEMTGLPELSRNYFEGMDYIYYQDKLSELQTRVNRFSCAQHREDEDLYDLIQEDFRQKNFFILSESLPNRPFTHWRLEPILVEQNASQRKQSARRIALHIRELINGVVNRKLSKVSINYGMKCVQTLLEMLSNENYRYRNHMFINDYRIASELKETDEFKQLCGYINKIDFDTSSEIQANVFLKAPMIQYNLDVHYMQDIPSEDECSEFVKRHQIANGTYQISGCRFDYSHAMQYVKDNFKLEIIDLFVSVDIDKNSGFIIDFNRSK